MVIFPVRNPQNAGLWDFAIEDYVLSVTPLIKRMLHLPTDTEPHPPPAAPDRRARAQALCEQVGMVKGRSAILCPYARSDPADGTPYFAALAAALHRLGYKVFTSVAGAETPITGTVPVTIPFSLLPETAEYAGWIVAVRSGVADIVSSAACRKSIIYQTFHALRNWSLATLGLCRDAAELVFRFGSGHPGDFAQAVIAGVHHVGGARVRGLSEVMAPQKTASLSSLNGGGSPAFLAQRQSTRLLAPLSRRLRARQGPLRISEVPSSFATRAREGAGTDLSAIARAAGDGRRRLFACRDGAGRDFFEPVEPLALSRAHYYWAAVWHTILLVGDPGSAGVAILDPVLPDDGIGFGVEVSLADALDTRAHRDELTGRLPLCYGGVQFLEGWSKLESWGLWSLSCFSVLKIILAEAPQGDLGVRLSASVAAFSSAMPVVAFDVMANGVEAGHFALPGSATPQRVEIMVPYRAVQNLRSILLEFRLETVMSPEQQGFGPADQRPIGLGIRSVRVDRR